MRGVIQNGNTTSSGIMMLHSEPGEIDGESYTKKDNTEFDWFRSRMPGGGTNHQGRISLHFGPKDFKPDVWYK